MTNTLKLKSKIIELNLKTNDIAKLLGISKTSFSMKLNNLREFKASEIQKLINILQINDFKECEKIFFANSVDLKSTTN